MPKSVFVPHLNRSVIIGGRKRPARRGLELRNRLSHYIRRTLPAAPSAVDYTPKASAALAQMYLNDNEGDCVVAGGYHLVGVATGNASGAPLIVTPEQINADYHEIGGYVVGDPATDNGCDEQTAFHFWGSHGFCNGTKLAGWLPIDPTDIEELRLALYLFEGHFYGLEMPDAWISPFPSDPGFVWDVAGDPNPDNGHCIVGVGYDARGVQVDTWGMIGTLTWAAIARYGAAPGGEVYLLLTPDMIARGQQRAPNGLSWAELVDDFNALGGSLPAAPPPPTPSPAPKPAPVVNLQDAQAWASEGIRALYPRRLIDRDDAERIVRTSLSKHWPTADVSNQT